MPFMRIFEFSLPPIHHSPHNKCHRLWNPGHSFYSRHILFNNTQMPHYSQNFQTHSVPACAIQLSLLHLDLSHTLPHQITAAVLTFCTHRFIRDIPTPHNLAENRDRVIILESQLTDSEYYYPVTKQLLQSLATTCPLLVIDSGY